MLTCLLHAVCSGRGLLRSELPQTLVLEQLACLALPCSPTAQGSPCDRDAKEVALTIELHCACQTALTLQCLKAPQKERRSKHSLLTICDGSDQPRGCNHLCSTKIVLSATATPPSLAVTDDVRRGMRRSSIVMASTSVYCTYMTHCQHLTHISVASMIRHILRGRDSCRHLANVLTEVWCH